MKLARTLAAAAAGVLLAIPIVAWAAESTTPTTTDAPCPAHQEWMDEHHADMPADWEEMRSQMNARGWDHGPGMTGRSGSMGGPAMMGNG